MMCVCSCDVCVRVMCVYACMYVHVRMCVYVCGECVCIFVQEYFILILSFLGSRAISFTFHSPAPFAGGRDIADVNGA